jgi:hypothetical protein
MAPDGHVAAFAADTTQTMTSINDVILRVDRPEPMAETIVARTEDGRSWVVPLTDKLRKRIGANSRVYFYARLRDGLPPKIGSFAPWQGW